MLKPRFTLDDANRAHDEWGANCGPVALAAIAGLTLDEVRPLMGNFERKHYTNPTLMFESLDRIGVKWSRTKEPLPAYGLLRIQWEGPWTKPSIQTRARYRHTHWIGFYNVPDGSTFGRSGVFDVNGLNNGSGWMLYRDWATILVPHILKTCEPLADGGWHITHAIEVEKPHRIATRTVLSFPGDPDIELTC